MRYESRSTRKNLCQLWESPDAHERDTEYFDNTDFIVYVVGNSGMDGYDQD